MIRERSFPSVCDAAVEDLGSIAERSSANERQRHSRIDAVIDSTELRAF